MHPTHAHAHTHTHTTHTHTHTYRQHILDFGAVLTCHSSFISPQGGHKAWNTSFPYSALGIRCYDCPRRWVGLGDGSICQPLLQFGRQMASYRRGKPGLSSSSLPHIKLILTWRDVPTTSMRSSSCRVGRHFVNSILYTRVSDRRSIGTSVTRQMLAT